MENMKGIFEGPTFKVGGPVPIKQEEIEVKVSGDDLLADYCKAFVAEAERKLPLVAGLEDALTADELISYSKFLLTQRLKSINFDCPDWRKLKLLWIPSFIQFTLSCIGVVIDRDYGLKFVPVEDQPSTMTFDDALLISNKIYRYFDKLQMVQDAMPRGQDGDRDVMMSAIIAGYITSTQRVSHPSATYVAAFWNQTVKEELAFKALYRIQYDDLNYIRSALIANEGALL